MDVIQTSFNAGELSPRLKGRVDLAKFHNGCITLRNFIALPHGPADRRSGLPYIAEVKDSTKKVRLIRFEAEDEESYMLEFGSGYVRFYHDGARIESGGVPIEVATVYAESELFEVKPTQSADVMYQFHRAHAIQKLSRLASDGSLWGVKSMKPLPPPTYEADTNVSGGTITLGIGAATGTGIKVHSSADVFLAADKDRQVKYLDGIGVITAVADAKNVTMDVTDDFLASLLSNGPGTLSTDVAGTAVTTSVAHGLAVGDYIVVTSGAQAGEVRRVTALDPDPTICTIDASFGAQQAAVTWKKCSPIPVNLWKLAGSPGATCTPSAKTPLWAIVTLTLSANGWRAADVGKYVLLLEGIVKITAYTSPTVVSGQIVQVLGTTAAAAAAGAWTLEVDSWSATMGYPAAGCLFQQRLMAGGTTAQPSTVWGSQSADYENFAGGSYDADALEYLLTSKKRASIRWMEDVGALIVGTAGAELRMSGGADNPITPSNIDVKSQTMHGSGYLPPVRIGHTVTFLQKAGRKVLQILYNLDSDSYVADDLTLLAEHLTEGGIVDMAWQQEPDGILWCVRTDGVLLGMTFNREQQVVAWHQHTTDGYFEAVETPPDPANNRDEVWVVVKRTIGGATKRYIERFVPGRNTDSCKFYAGSARTFTGLSHLEGKTVKVVANGAIYKDQVVSGGQITIDASEPDASNVEIGLPFTSTLVPMPPDFVSDKGMSFGKKKQWDRIIVRVHETGGIEINGKPHKWRSGADPLGSPPELFTGDIEIANLGISGEGLVTIEQKLPRPATILAIAGDLSVGD